MLIVDDQQSVLVSLEFLLGWSGYKVLTALSGPEAVAIAETVSIDGALIDIHMPEMDGFQVAERLRAATAVLGRPVKIWFMSGALSGQLKRRSLEVGAMAVFSKPFDLTLHTRLEEGFTAPSESRTATNPPVAANSDAEAES